MIATVLFYFNAIACRIRNKETNGGWSRHVARTMKFLSSFMMGVNACMGGLRKSVAAAGGVAIALALLAGPSAASAARRATPIAVKVGFEAPLSGIVAANGVQEVDGWRLGLRLLGSRARPYRIVTDLVDTHGDPTIALSDAKELASSGLALMEGPLLANEEAAVAAYLKPLRIPLDDVGMCSASQLQNYESGFGYSPGWTCDQTDSVAADYLFHVRHIRHVTLVATDYAFGWISMGTFAAEFRRLGGRIDAAIWPPANTTDYAPYVSEIPSHTQAVYAVMSGANAANFVKAYRQYGLARRIPLYGTTTLTDYSVLPAEGRAALGVHIVAQYCDGLPTPANRAFQSAFHRAYHVYAGYYGELGYAKAAFLVAALAGFHGKPFTPAALAEALKRVRLTLPRGPVAISPVTATPVQNIYVCVVRPEGGVLHNVPVATFRAVPPWGLLPYGLWKATYIGDSSGRPNL
jgi:branched-chain amino acid transport system substrate-binding protein